MNKLNLSIQHKDDAETYKKEYSKAYYHQYKTVATQKRNEKMQCSVCKKVITRQSVWAHKKSKKCIKLQETSKEMCPDSDTRIQLKSGPVYIPKEYIEKF